MPRAGRDREPSPLRRARQARKTRALASARPTCRAAVDPLQALTPLLEVLGGQITHTQHVPRLDPSEDPRPAGAVAVLQA